ncbi:MAG: ABC transporter ATP-binding protein, partial [bacterium]|nr:ABC transporter ATP-binding protein [bacterium]
LSLKNKQPEKASSPVIQHGQLADKRSCHLSSFRPPPDGINTSGYIRVLGLDPDKAPVELKRRVGFVADNQRMYGWMTVDEIIGFCRSFYPTWDDAFTGELLRLFELPRKVRLRDMSRGMYGKVALLLGLAHRPELLILDDPTSGLDPVVRREFMHGVIEAVQRQHCTVFFSTHIVDEAEQVADWVGIIDDGHLVLSQPVEQAKEAVKRIRVVFDDVVPEKVVLPGLLESRAAGRELMLTVRDFTPETVKAVSRYNPLSVEVLDQCLEDVFVALVKKPVGETL